MMRRPPRSTLDRSSAASDVYKRQLLYIQPMFISTGLSERVEVITGIRLQIEPVEQSSSSVEFVWDEQGGWVVDPSTQDLNWVFTGDSGPVSYTHLRAHETVLDLVCRLLLEKKKKNI